MRSIKAGLLVFLLLGAGFVYAQDSAPDPVGDWNIIVVTPDGELPGTMNLMKSEETLVCAIKTADGRQYKVGKTTLDGPALSFEVATDDGGLMKVDLKFQASSFSGNVLSPAYGNLAIRGTRKVNLSTQSTLRMLRDNEAARAVVNGVLPQFWEHPQIDQALDMTMREIQQYASDVLTDDVLAQLDAELAKI